ncbi:MAG: hypothetical protein OEZ51_06445 [Nitrospinota bacterium]|nr:hypothetical protein [Nitrospinota bacterium]
MRWFCVLALTGLLAGCYTQKIEEAFERDVAAAESNRVIHDYCRSCHIHKDFSSVGHIEEMSVAYNRKVFRYATECRTCHYLEKKFSLNDFTRKTRRPEEANQGEFKEFELEILRAQKEKEK